MSNSPNPACSFSGSLSAVFTADYEALHSARNNYGESWCRRGGVGAFMMLARKWDRLENYLSKPASGFDKYDILEALQFDDRPEGLIDDVRDLRRYLALVEAKLVELGRCPKYNAKDTEGKTFSVSNPFSGLGSAPILAGHDPAVTLAAENKRLHDENISLRASLVASQGACNQHFERTQSLLNQTKAQDAARLDASKAVFGAIDCAMQLLQYVLAMDVGRELSTADRPMASMLTEHPDWREFSACVVKSLETIRARLGEAKVALQ